ncbi:hypothetical protein BH24ACT5_BH24ACT5_04690 [soil metagenome]
MHTRLAALIATAAILGVSIGLLIVTITNNEPGDKTIDTEMITGWETFWTGLDDTAQSNACDNLQADRNTITRAGDDMHRAAPDIFPSAAEGQAFFAWVLVTKC